jgi:DNA (cytosine-5)-methyltransferase 1
MNELALFAGAGGGILGGHLLGWRTVCAVEWEPYPASVLIARQNEGVLPPFPIWDDVRTFDGRPWRGRVDVVSGGFPCQDISAAGKGAGIDGERSGMWAHMARIIREVGPRYAFVENSPMLTSRGLGRVLGDLAAMGYDARWGVLGAVDAGAPHKRDRIWIVAHAQSGESRKQTERQRRENLGGGGCDFPRPEDSWPKDLADAEKQRARGLPIGTSSEYTRLGFVGEDVADAGHLLGRHGAESNETQPASFARCGEVCDTVRKGLEGADALNVACESSRQHGEIAPTTEAAFGGVPRIAWWATEPDVGRVAHGVAARVDRLKAIGNGQVPAVAALAWRILSK